MPSLIEMLQDSQTPDVVQSLLGTTFFDKEAAIGKRIGDPQISDKSIDPLQAFVNKGPSLKGTLGNLVSGAQDQFGRTFDMIDEKFPGVLGDLDANARNLVSDPVGQTSAAIEAGANLTDFKVDPITKKAQEANDEADAASKNAQVAQREAASADIAQQSKVSMAQAGATKEELSAWDKFSSEYDLATIGMALMASNDGSSTFSSNFGKALMAGKAVKAGTAEKARTDALEERKVGATERTADAAMLRASAQYAKTGKRSIVDNATTIKTVGAWLTGQGVNEDAATAKSQQFATDVAELHAKSGLSLAQAQQRMFEVYQTNGIFTPTGFFTSGDLE